MSGGELFYHQVVECLEYELMPHVEPHEVREFIAHITFGLTDAATIGDLWRESLLGASGECPPAPATPVSRRNYTIDCVGWLLALLHFKCDSFLHGFDYVWIRLRLCGEGHLPVDDDAVLANLPVVSKGFHQEEAAGHWAPRMPGRRPRRQKTERLVIDKDPRLPSSPESKKRRASSIECCV